MRSSDLITILVIGLHLISRSGSIPAANQEKKRPPGCRTGRRIAPDGEPETGSGGAGSRASPGNTAGPVWGCGGQEPIQGKVREEPEWCPDDREEPRSEEHTSELQ